MLSTSNTSQNVITFETVVQPELFVQMQKETKCIDNKTILN